MAYITPPPALVKRSCKFSSRPLTLSILHLLLDNVDILGGLMGAVIGRAAGAHLVLLILSDKIEEVGVRVRELVLLHTLAREPVEEGLALEHEGKLGGDALEDLVDDGAVAQERARDLQARGWNVAHGGLHVVRYPVDEVRRVLRLHV